MIAAIKELQCDHTGARFSVPVGSGDVGGSKLCVALEALLLHGTKHSFLGKIGATFALSPSAPSPGKRAGPLPETNFWLAAVTFSPKHVVDSVGALRQIRCDVGKSRAWVRMALNDGEIVNYLTAMKESRLLPDFYEKDALIRDLETMDVIIKYLLGIQGWTTFSVIAIFCNRYPNVLH